MKKSIYILEKLSMILDNHQTHYKFNKQNEHLTDKYRKGRINASKWLNELIYYYINKERQFIVEFKEQIQEQKKHLSDLEDGDFKQGLFDELNLVEDMINERTNNSK